MEKTMHVEKQHAKFIIKLCQIQSPKAIGTSVLSLHVMFGTFSVERNNLYMYIIYIHVIYTELSSGN